MFNLKAITLHPVTPSANGPMKLFHLHSFFPKLISLIYSIALLRIMTDVKNEIAIVIKSR